MKLSGSIIGDINYKKYKKIEKEYIEYARSKIPVGILECSSKMKININTLLKNLLEHTNHEEFDTILATFLGIVGNYYAYEYFNWKYSGIIEKEVHMKYGTNVMCADLVRRNKKHIYIYEVKTTNQLILDDLHIQYGPQKGTIEHDNFRLKKQYLNISSNLLKQMEKLVSYRFHNDKIRIGLVIYSDCYIQEELKEKLKNNNIKIYIIPKKVEEMIIDIRNMLCDIYTYGRNILDEANLCPRYKVKKRRNNGTLLD